MKNFIDMTRRILRRWNESSPSWMNLFYSVEDPGSEALYHIRISAHFLTEDNEEFISVKPLYFTELTGSENPRRLIAFAASKLMYELMRKKVEEEYPDEEETKE